MKYDIVGYIIISIILILLLTFSIKYVLFINNIKPDTNFENFISTGPIDAVYTWVDSNNTEWIKQKNTFSENQKNESIDCSKARWTTTESSYRELEFSIRSTRRFIPWIRNIYIVTQRPQKMPYELSKELGVIYVHHDEIMPQDALPTFNSCAIETSLHKIKGLSEKFIYFNDDMIVNKQMEPSDFFKNDKPIFRISKMYSFFLNNIILNFKNEKHIDQLIFSKDLLKNTFYIPIHQATPITKSLLINIEEKYNKQWNKTRYDKFRKSDNIIPIYLALNVDRMSVYITNIDNIKEFVSFSRIYTIKNFNPYHLICINTTSITDNKINRKYRQEIIKQRDET